jgi:integrase
VQRTLTRGEDGRGWVVGASTKSGKGRRVRLTRRAVAALKDHRRRQLEERMRLAGLCQDQDLIFPNEIGSLLNPSNLRNRSFKRIKMRSGVREAHPHFFPPRASPREPLRQRLYSHKESLEGSFEKRST